MTKKIQKKKSGKSEMGIYTDLYIHMTKYFHAYNNAFNRSLGIKFPLLQHCGLYG